MEECPVCYSAEAKLTTRCGHKFCFGCVKQWLCKSGEDSSPTCPMCRTTLHFKGLNKIKEALEEERYNNQCSDIFDKLIESVAEQIKDSTEKFPDFKSYFQFAGMSMLKDTEETMRVLKYDYSHPEDITDVILEGWYLNFDKEMKRDRKSNWQQRDKVQRKYERKHVMKCGR